MTSVFAHTTRFCVLLALVGYSYLYTVLPWSFALHFVCSFVLSLWLGWEGVLMKETLEFLAGLLES